MKLTQPTDFDILSVLSDGKRNNAVNIAEILDQERSYMNTRLPVLEDYGLIESVGPAENSGLYVITERGQQALQYQDKYNTDDVDFEDLLE
jgi:DNA-binding MarR family transcriptional regulator